MALALLASPGAMAPSAPSEPAGPAAGDYVLDGRTASLIIKLSSVPGLPSPALRLTRLDGRLHYDPARWEATNVTISADPKSIETSRGPVAQRAKALFEPNRYPTIQFTSTSLRLGESDRGEAVGELTFHGVTRPLVISVVLQDSNPGGPGAEERLRFSGSGTLKRSDFGVSEGRWFVGDTVDLAFDLDFVKQPAGEAQR